MTLRELTEGIEIVSSNAEMDAEVKGIKIDSRKVRASDLFIALSGEKDGHNYIGEALKNGAFAIVCNKAINQDIPHIQVRDTRKAFALIASNYYGNAHKKMKIIFVTGTNGKTTTTYIINSLLKANGHKTAVIGTLGAVIDEKKINTDLTTPDPLDLHRLFSKAYESGVEYVIMEASAHAIYYKKLEGLKAEAAVFTNISQDHLDFFGNMAKYARTKTSFFSNERMKLSIINSDDEYGRKILSKKNCLCLSYGINNPSDVFAVDIVTYNAKTRFILNAFDEVAEITIPLYGRFNVYNTLAAIAVARALSIPMSVILKALSGLKEVSGRFNIIKEDITVIIDYAHTPDGLENLLKAVKSLDGGRIITVFGCGGNRDAVKRPIMGTVAAMYSDFCVITSDNPRFEDPMDIIRQVEKGVRAVTQNYICIKDRENAIAYAIKFAQAGDKVVVAGKGGENYLDIMGVKHPYSDKKAVMSAIRSYRN
ncbi:MAG: UDP-N-acetylmuramoyl-L-alanyl-D-glutamate--2,6-diaminopimelate ligase [Christensenellales bacterium]|nr:UDP-N-acetylmuramoyl-L-alanyl-D-glutamate--2,6-diaminopimelate ligase [Clostridiales bacterium]